MLNDKKYQKLNSKLFSNARSCKDSQEFQDEKKRQKLIVKSKSTKREIKRKKKIKSFISTNPQYKKFKETALRKNIKLGMPEALLILSWGKADKVNETTGPWGVHKQCVYGSQYVYIKKGHISSWQNK